MTKDNKCMIDYRKIVHKLRANGLFKIMTDILYMLLFEYISNHIISKIPCRLLRIWYYKNILRIKLSNNAYIMLGCYIYPDISEDIIIGDNTVINSNVILDRRGGLYIGNNVNISRDVAIYTGGHIIDSPDFKYYHKKVVIKDYVWIGTRALIMPGVTISEGAVVLPNAVVTHDCDPYAVYGGVPAKKIRLRNDKLQYELTWRSYFL